MKSVIVNFELVTPWLADDDVFVSRGLVAAFLCATGTRQTEYGLIFLILPNSQMRRRWRARRVAPEAADRHIPP